MPSVIDTSTWKPTIIPIIKKVIPSMIAADIVGVQPMTGPSGLIFAMKTKYGSMRAAWQLSSYAQWLERNLLTDDAQSVNRYIEELLE